MPIRTTMPHRLWLRAGLLLCLSGTLAGAAELTSARRAELHNLVKQDCGSCHGMTLKGGLGSSLLPSDLDGVDEETIVQIVLDGVPGKPMPPWRGLLSNSDALWIAHALKMGAIK